MRFSEIEYDIADQVAVLTLNRPEKLNAWTPTMAAEVRTALRDAADDASVRVIVLTGKGRGFCAGVDMTRLSGMTEASGMKIADEEAFDPGARADFRHRQAYFPSVPKPLIAAINDPCAGLGMVLTLYCDMRFASPDAVFSTAFARRGLIAEHGISWLLPRIVGMSKAMDLLMSARKVAAAEALRMGLVDRVSEPGALMNDALAYARELATLSSPRSLGIIKRQVWNAQFETLAEAMAVADAEMHLSLGSEDFKEGVRHFVEKRPPSFSGR